MLVFVGAKERSGIFRQCRARRGMRLKWPTMPVLLSERVRVLCAHQSVCTPIIRCRLLDLISSTLDMFPSRHCMLTVLRVFGRGSYAREQCVPCHSAAAKLVGTASQ